MGSKRRDLDYKAIGRRIKHYRQEAGIPQEVFAEQLDLSASHYSNVENGKCAVTLPVLIEIANMLDIDQGLLVQDVVKHTKRALTEEAAKVFDDATEYEARVLLASLKDTKTAMRKYASLIKP